MASLEKYAGILATGDIRAWTGADGLAFGAPEVCPLGASGLP